MTEEQKEKFWELAAASRRATEFHAAQALAADKALEAYVLELIADAYQAGREDERKAVRLWGAK